MSRSSSVRVKTRVGSDASFASSWNSLWESFSGIPRIDATRATLVDREVAGPPGALRLQDGADPLDELVVEALFAQLLLDRRHRSDGTGGFRPGLDVLWAETVTIHPHPSARVVAVRAASQSAGADDPQSSQIAEHAGGDEAEGRDDVQAEDVRPGLREDPDQARADQPAGDDQRDRRAGWRSRRACASGRRAPCARSRARSRPSRTCSSVSCTWYGSAEAACASWLLSRRARPATRLRREALDHRARGRTAAPPRRR